VYPEENVDVDVASENMKSSKGRVSLNICKNCGISEIYFVVSQVIGVVHFSVMYLEGVMIFVRTRKKLGITLWGHKISGFIAFFG